MESSFKHVYARDTHARQVRSGPILVLVFVSSRSNLATSLPSYCVLNGQIRVLRGALAHAEASGDPRVEASVRSTLASALSRSGLAKVGGGGEGPSSARQHMEKAMALRKKNGSSGAAEMARTAINLAALTQEEGDGARARSLFKEVFSWHVCYNICCCGVT